MPVFIKYYIRYVYTQFRLQQKYGHQQATLRTHFERSDATYPLKVKIMKVVGVLFGWMNKQYYTCKMSCIDVRNPKLLIILIITVLSKYQLNPPYSKISNVNIMQ